MKANIIALVALLSPLSPAAAATLYVAPSGGQYSTLQAAVNAARPGDTIVVRDGTYGPTGGSGSHGVTLSRAGTASAWITLRAENPGRAILDCQKVCQAYINLPTSAASYWVIQGFDIRNTTRFGIVAYPSGAHDVRITGNRIHHIGNVYDSSSQGIAGIYTDTNQNFVVDGNVIHDVGRTAVLTYSHDHGIYTHGVNMVISNNVFHTMFNGWHIQTASGFSGTIANNTFIGPNAGTSKNGQIVLWDQNGTVIVRNNLFYGPRRAAMTNVSARMSGTCSFDHNLVYAPGATLSMIDSVPSGCSQSANLLNVDPRLTSPSVPNFDAHLLPGSPAIDKGVALAQVRTDFDGKPRPQGAAYDIGAFEGGGSAPTPAPTAPVISAVSASGIGANGATISWTTDRAADTQVAYGPTASYGSMTTLNPAMTTAHSAALTGLAAGTVYHYSVRSKDAAGLLASSPDATFTTTGGAPPAPGCVSSAGTWQSASFPAQTAPFTVEFDATPSQANMDGVAGLANGAASDYGSLAAIVRFNNAGRVDARNGGSYAAAVVYPYLANMTYRVRLVVDLPNRVYDAFVRQGSNPERQIATRYAFRAEQASAARLDRASLYASVGTLQLCNATATAGSPGAAPVISALAATGVGPSGATISWTTDKPADSQVVYGPTTAYGSGTTPNTTLTTAHSVALSGLTAGTVYHYSAKSKDAAGRLTSSPDATFTTVAGTPAPTPGCLTSAGSWQNSALTAQTGAFTAEWEATPAAANIDGVAGLAAGPAADYAALAAAVRFNNAGRIDARNGSVYAAAAPIPYAAGQPYRFRLAVDVAARRYSVWVRQGSGAEQLLGSNFAFRTEQAAASRLAGLGVYASAGSLKVCNATASSGGGIGGPPPAGACVTSAGTWQNTPVPEQSGTFTTEWDATPSAASIDGVSGLSAGAAADYAAVAAAVRFNNAGRVDARNGGTYASASSIPYAAGQTYRVRVVVNLPARTYSAYVKQGAGPEQLVGANYAFRTEQASATRVANLAAYASTGSLKVCRP